MWFIYSLFQHFGSMASVRSWGSGKRLRIDEQKPGLRSVEQYSTVILRSLSRSWYTPTQVSAQHMYTLLANKRLKIKRWQCERLLFYYCRILLVPQIHFLYREALFPAPWKIWHYNNKPARCKHTWLLKGTGDNTLIGVLLVTPTTHPWLFKGVNTALKNPAPGAATIQNWICVIRFSPWA